MDKKRINKVNGAVAAYYGIGSIVGALSGLVGLGVWIFKVLTEQTNFSWGTLIFLILLTVGLGLMGYFLLRVGNEEIKR